MVAATMCGHIGGMSQNVRHAIALRQEVAICAVEDIARAKRVDGIDLWRGNLAAAHAITPCYRPRPAGDRGDQRAKRMDGINDIDIVMTGRMETLRHHGVILSLIHI